MFSVLVSYNYTEGNKCDEILYFPRIPVTGDHIVLVNGLHKVVWTRLYAFTEDKANYPGVVSHILIRMA